MSITEAHDYVDRHPKEAWRFAKAHGQSAIELTQKALRHCFTSGILFPELDTANFKYKIQ